MIDDTYYILVYYGLDSINKFIKTNNVLSTNFASVVVDSAVMAVYESPLENLHVCLEVSIIQWKI